MPQGAEKLKPVRCVPDGYIWFCPYCKNSYKVDELTAKLKCNDCGEFFECLDYFSPGWGDYAPTVDPTAYPPGR